MPALVRLPVAVPALVTLMLASPLPAQDRKLPPLVERMEVTVVNVEAVVTDRDGRRITGLTKDDFEIYENGKRQPITNFYEVTPAASAESFSVKGTKEQPSLAAPASAPRQPLRLAVLIDQRSLIPSARERVLGQIRSFVEASVRPGDETMLAVWDLRLAVPVPFTSDPVPVAEGLSRISLGLGPFVDQAADRSRAEYEVQQAIDAELARDKGMAPLSDDPDSGIPREILALETRIEMRRKVAALKSVIRRMSGLEGRKVLLFVTQKFPYCAVYAISGPCNPEYTLQPLIDTVGEAANANGVAVYAIYAAPNTLETNSADRARPSTSFELLLPMIKDIQSSSALQSVALASGGLSTTGPELTKYFSSIESDLNSYYSLGYSATRGQEKRTRSIRVVARNRQYQVRTRKSVIEKSASDQLNDELVSLLLAAGNRDSGDLSFGVRLGKPKPARKGRFLVPVEISLPIRDLTLIEEGGTYRGGVMFHIVSSDRRGDLSDVTRKQHRLDIPAQDLESVRESTFTYELELLVDERGEKVAFAVADEISGTTGMQIVDLPAR